MRTDGKTWRKLIVAFRNFANAPKNNKTVLNCVYKSTSKNFWVLHWTQLRALHITDVIYIVQSFIQLQIISFTVLVLCITITNKIICFIEMNPVRGLIGANE